MPKAKGQSSRLTVQQKEGQGPITIFHEDAQIHDKEVGNTSLFVVKQLEYEFPMLKFRYRKDLSKKEINEALQRVDPYLGQTLFVESASIRPDGGLIEVQDDKGKDSLRRYGKDQRFIRGLGKLALAYVGAGELDDQLELIKPAG